MQDLEKSPLCAESDIFVYRPSLDFFINKIKKNEYFSFTRQMHGLWDSVIGAWILEPELRKVQLSEEAYRKKLANAMSKGKQDVEGLYYEPAFYVELLEIIASLDSTEPNFFFGISDTHFFPEVPPPYLPEHFALPNKCTFKYLNTQNPLKYYKLRFADRQSVMKLLLPQNTSFFDASIWKMYAYKNQIWEFFECIKDYPVILVGPQHYKDFGSLAGFSNYTHLPIHGSKASINRKEIIEKVVQKHQSFEHSKFPPVYFFVAGSVSVYLVYHLHQRLENKFLIDTGQAFNFLYHKKEALLHREFGHSEKNEKGRKAYNSQKLYGQRNFHSNMRIKNNEVSFDLKLSFREIWLEKLMLWVNERAIRRKLLYLRHTFYNIFKNAKNTEK